MKWVLNKIRGDPYFPRHQCSISYKQYSLNNFYKKPYISIKYDKMKKLYFLAFSIFVLRFIAPAQATHIITTHGYAFLPDSLVVNLNDTVVFNVNFSMYPIQQVRDTSWAANHPTPMAGGFSDTSGNTLRLAMTQQGIVYYVCTVYVAPFEMKGRIYVSGPESGIETIPSVTALPYPNPADQQLNFVSASSGELSYTITDMLGRTMLLGRQYATGQNMVTVDVSAVATGNYILSISNAGGAISQTKIDISH
jgi:plastocyanin